MFFRGSNISVPQNLLEEAEALLYHASPMTDIRACTGVQALMSVEGEVIEVSFTLLSSIKIVSTVACALQIYQEEMCMCPKYIHLLSVFIILLFNKKTDNNSTKHLVV